MVIYELFLRKHYKTELSQPRDDWDNYSNRNVNEHEDEKQLQISTRYTMNVTCPNSVTNTN